jgi:hypothetical protein
MGNLFGKFPIPARSAGVFFAYRRTDLPDGQRAFVATPEEALLDLIHLQPGADGMDYLKGLRLQQLDQLDAKALQRIVDTIGKPKLARAAKSAHGSSRFGPARLPHVRCLSR